MKISRSVDLDGLDGIISSPDKLRSKSVGLKAIWITLLIVLAVIILFFMQNQWLSPLTLVKTPAQPTASASLEPSKILPETLKANSADQVEHVTSATVDTRSTPENPEVSIRSEPGQSLQDSGIQAPAAQNQSEAPILPAEPTAAGNPAKTASNALFNVYFRLDSSTPVRLSEAETSHLIDLAKSCPNRIRITGYTCNLGGAAGNLWLGQVRANAVKKILMASGIAARQIETASEGENMPIASNDTPAGRASNRRAVVNCLGQ